MSFDDAPLAAMVNLPMVGGAEARDVTASRRELRQTAALNFGHRMTNCAGPATDLSGLPLHDFKSLCLQFQKYALC
ncbi:hypothetical protein BJS_05821 [Bradyrhizobium japonicum SEMIA 5079]|nr:hypothetical protein BJS_05821 [Bradyrhizobium japonicum SEMIA 5079]